jgi:hypothetical protein
MLLQVRTLLDRAYTVSKMWNDAPVILCGDFNSTPKVVFVLFCLSMQHFMTMYYIFCAVMLMLNSKKVFNVCLISFLFRVRSTILCWSKR